MEPTTQRLIEHLRAVYDLVTGLDGIMSTSPLNQLRQDYCDVINRIVELLRQNGMSESALDDLRDELDYKQAARQFNNYIMQRYQERCPVRQPAYVETGGGWAQLAE